MDGAGAATLPASSAPAPAVVDAAPPAEATVSTAPPPVDPSSIAYTCRRCRMQLFTGGDTVTHEVGQQQFSYKRRAKAQRGVAEAASVDEWGALDPEIAAAAEAMRCDSYFLEEPAAWMGVVEGRLACPNAACKARVGSLKWAGSQCSCACRVWGVRACGAAAAAVCRHHTARVCVCVCVCVCACVPPPVSAAWHRRAAVGMCVLRGGGGTAAATAVAHASCCTHPP